MPLNKIWERYFLREIRKTFTLCLLGFYTLYVVIDYANHSSSFKHHNFHLFDILSYYTYEFFVRMDVLVPFAILIAGIKTLTTANANNELVALMSSGIPLKRLLWPLMCFGFFFTIAVYCNTEWLQPLAVKNHNKLEESRTKKKHKKYKHPLIQQISLQDGSSIIFQDYDTSSQKFFDAYWIRSIDNIYRIKYLSHHDVPVGERIEHLERDASGNLIISESFSKKLFTEMSFDQQTVMATVSMPNEQSLSVLKEKIPPNREIRSDKDAQILTTYYYKLAFPWLCLLAIIAPAPFCTSFSRTLPIFFIYAGSIFGMVAFYIIMDAALIFGERQVLSPELAIGIPFSLCFAFFGWRFARL